MTDAPLPSGLTDTMRVPGPITLFAPTDDAFEELSADVNARLRSNPRLVEHLLGHHVAQGLYFSADLTSGPIVVLDGHELEVADDGTTTLVEGVPIVEADVRAGNGVVHLVNRLLMPGELDLTGTSVP